MRKNLGSLLFLLFSALCLSGCLNLRPLGPCYGVGCPALSSQQGPQNAGVQQSAPPSKAAENEPSQSQSESAGDQSAAAQTSQSGSATSGPNQPTQSQAQQAKTSKPKKGLLEHLKFW